MAKSARHLFYLQSLPAPPYLGFMMDSLLLGEVWQQITWSLSAVGPLFALLYILIGLPNIFGRQMESLAPLRNFVFFVLFCLVWGPRIFLFCIVFWEVALLGWVHVGDHAVNHVGGTN